MSLVDKPFKDALKHLPLRKLSWQADRRIRKQLKMRARQLDGHVPFWVLMKRLIAAPVALALVLTSTGGYAYYSPSVVQADLLYPIKSELESAFYPEDGTSEERVAYHLWLSDRRYAEVQEILSRRGKDLSAAVAFAQSEEGDLLDDILAQTLERATQHVEYAFLVTKEIREVKRVEEVKEQIRGTLEKQKVVLEEVKPVLKEVKLKNKKAARKKKVVETTPLTVPVALEMLKAQPELELAPVETESVAAQESRLATDGATPENIENASISGTDEPLPEPAVESLPKNEAVPIVPVPVVLEDLDEEEELEDAEAFVADRLAFQEELLAKLDEEVEQASMKGEDKVEIAGVDELVEIAEKEVKEVEDRVIVAAFTTHLKVEKELLKGEVEALEKVAVVKTPLQKSPTPERLPEELLPPVLPPPDVNLEDLPEVSKDGEALIAQNENASAATTMVADPLPVDPEGSAADVDSPEPKLEGGEIAAEEIPVNELPNPAAVSFIAEDEGVTDVAEDAEQDTDEALVGIASDTDTDLEAALVEEDAAVGEIAEEGDSTTEETDEEDFDLGLYCEAQVQRVCLVSSLANCRTILLRLCNEELSKEGVDALMLNAHQRVSEVTQEEDMQQKVNDKKTRLQQIDESLQRLESQTLLNAAPSRKAPAQIIRERE